MAEVTLTALAIGGAGGLWLGYQLGQIKAARRASRNTYRSVRGR